jgi:hypothetical protein
LDTLKTLPVVHRHLSRTGILTGNGEMTAVMRARVRA